MKALNHLNRRGQIIKFLLFFMITFVMLSVNGYFTLVIAQKGILLVEKKQAKYDEVFKKQAELGFKLDETFKNLYNLKNKRRNAGEYKQMQKIITDTRVVIEKEIDTTKKENSYYKVYAEFLKEVKTIQSMLDLYEKEFSKREYNKDQLEKCRDKYQQLNKK